MHIKNRSILRFFSILLAIAIIVSAACFGAAADDNTASSNSTPIAENLEFSTYKNIALSGKLSAVDPDGDELTFSITREPKKGTVELSENGDFVYTPRKDKKGKDSFCYTAADTCGNVSAEATVSIKIKSQTTDICYSDMDGNSAGSDAICLAENGIFIGEKIGSSYYFSPDTAVTRNEFLAMCMTMCGVENLSDITKTGFADDDSIPTWSKPYVATALMAGIIHGYRNTDGSIVFSANEPVTYSEAVVILDNVLDITDTAANQADASESCPTWAYQSAANLASCKIIAEISDAGSSSVLTRADAAKMLAASLNVIENRPSGFSLFGWMN